jgi:hypothetical protein
MAKIRRAKKKWGDTKNQERHKVDLARSVRKNGEFPSWNTESMHPQSVVDTIAKGLRQKVPGGKVSLLLIPGRATLRGEEKSQLEAKSAYEAFQRICDEKRKGGILDTFVVSESAAGRAHVDGEGRIYLEE